MNRKQRISIVKIATTVTFFAMVIVNWLAQGLMINGVNPKVISDTYPNLFAPAAVTFAIWGSIYLLLAAFTFYQDGFFQSNNEPVKRDILYIVGIWFSISSVANICWIFAWNYSRIGLSMFFMTIILICLTLINRIVNHERYTFKEKIFIRLPFSVYFGWIIVATIANATTLLVSVGWNRFGVSDDIWVMIVICVGMIIGNTLLIRYRDIAFGMALIWAYLGILAEHIMDSGYAGKYQSVITITGICIILFLAAELYVIVLKVRNRK